MGVPTPCKQCNKMPCGAHHDKCEEYQKWLAERREGTKNMPYSVLPSAKTKRTPNILRKR